MLWETREEEKHDNILWFFSPAVGGKEQICLPSSCDIHLSGSPGSSGLSYLLRANPACWECRVGRTKRHLQQLCAAVPHHKQHQLRDFYLSFPQVSHLETSDRGHNHQMPNVHQLLLKSQTISPHLVLRSSASWGPAGPAGSITRKTACKRSLQLSHRPLLPLLLTPCSSCSSVPLLPWRALHYSLLESHPTWGYRFCK